VNVANRMPAAMSVRYALLALLSDGPKDGPQLGAELAAATGEARPPSAGQVHTALQRLERDGLVAPDGAGVDGLGRRFRITAYGARELAGWLRRPPDMASSPHDELTTKILLALRVPGTDVHEMVQAHRRHQVERMQRWTRIKQGNAGHDLRAALAVDAELFRLDSLIRWLDAADGHLERADGHLEPIARPSWPVPPTLPRPAASAWRRRLGRIITGRPARQVT
jgi:DNA-binding PadR family transcriptional regulator